MEHMICYGMAKQIVKGIRRWLGEGRLTRLDSETKYQLTRLTKIIANQMEQYFSEDNDPKLNATDKMQECKDDLKQKKFFQVTRNPLLTFFG
jgi:hypothetical protein